MKRKNAPFIGKAVKAEVRLGDIEPGPVMHKQLSPELEERIRKFEPVFAEVYPISHSQWLDGFQRDLNPEGEVALWECMASAYQTLLVKHALTQPERKEAFGLLTGAAGTVEETLSRVRLCHLSHKKAKELLQLYMQTYKLALEKAKQQSSSN